MNHPLREEQTGVDGVCAQVPEESNTGARSEVHGPCFQREQYGSRAEIRSSLRGTAVNHLLSREAHRLPNIGCLANIVGHTVPSLYNFLVDLSSTGLWAGARVTNHRDHQLTFGVIMESPTSNGKLVLLWGHHGGQTRSGGIKLCH